MGVARSVEVVQDRLLVSFKLFNLYILPLDVLLYLEVSLGQTMRLVISVCGK